MRFRRKRLHGRAVGLVREFASSNGYELAEHKVPVHKGRVYPRFSILAGTVFVVRLRGGVVKSVGGLKVALSVSTAAEHKMRGPLAGHRAVTRHPRGSAALDRVLKERNVVEEYADRAS